MQRLLSPNEAKFWLLDSVAPMNSVVVMQRPSCDAVSMSCRFDLPVVHLDDQKRPRWGAADRPGILLHEDAADEMDWLTAAQRLLDVRVGSAGSPPWHAVVQHHPGGTTLVLAINHTLSDWRRGLQIARAFLTDEHPGSLAPPCEEMLSTGLFAAPDADALLDSWWSNRAGARWQALGRDRLTAILPPPTQTRLALHRLSTEDTEHLSARCEAEGVSLNGALAIALRDTMGIDAVAHSVDMERFIRPPPPIGPGLAVAHVFTPLSTGSFWDAARDNRADLFAQVRDGAAGDTLLALPRLLLGGTLAYQPATMTITGAPTVGSPGGADPDAVMQLVLSSARGGGGVLIISYHGNCLQLLAGSPADQPTVPLTAIAANLRTACT